MGNCTHDVLRGFKTFFLRVFYSLYRTSRTQNIGDFMDSHRQPWVKHDINAILAEADIRVVREGNFVGLHVRRGDKLTKEAKRIEVEVSYARRLIHISAVEYTYIVFLIYVYCVSYLSYISSA